MNKAYVAAEAIDPDDYSVYDYEDASDKEGAPSADLVAMSLAAGDTGAVCAYRDEVGIWQYVRDDEADHYRRLGCDVHTVYVQA